MAVDLHCVVTAHMTDHEFAGESGTNSAADAAWLRISARVDRVLKRVESAAAALLERKLTDDERTDAAAAANQIAAWLGHLGLAAAAALSRQLAALWEPDEPKAGVPMMIHRQRDRPGLLQGTSARFTSFMAAMASS